MWIHLNLIAIGMFTILIPSAMYGNLNPVVMSTFLFMIGIYLTTLYFILLYYKETRDKAIKELEELKSKIDNNILK
ncbi:MAG: hypothetical protein KatS3mg068_2575 [Candidatus Sericytochromatia bacterium]|nr:MAG: hypothetical protein KatS3mg068_2575 [Candidatus Sericytochromatia bacterium]